MGNGPPHSFTHRGNDKFSPHEVMMVDCVIVWMSHRARAYFRLAGRHYFPPSQFSYQSLPLASRLNSHVAISNSLFDVNYLNFQFPHNYDFTGILNVLSFNDNHLKEIVLWIPLDDARNQILTSEFDQKLTRKSPKIEQIIELD